MLLHERRPDALSIDEHAEPGASCLATDEEISALRREHARLLAEREALQARIAALAEVRQRLAVVANKPFPVYLTHDLVPTANPRSGRTRERILICSIPKAGTHLYGRVLELLGIQPSGLFLSMTYLNDGRFSTLHEARHDFLRTQLDIPINESVRLIQPGQFAVGHLERSLRTIELLASFKIIFLYREMRDVAVSGMRFASTTAWGTAATRHWRPMPETPEKMLCFFDDIGSFFFDSMCHPVVAWFGQAHVLSLSFEQIMGDFGAERQSDTICQMREFCRVEGSPVDARELLSQAIGAETVTWSGSRSQWQACWSDEVEHRFVELGGKELNRRLGYPG